MAAGSPLGPVQLHNLFLVGMKEPGQAGTVAAGAFDRPHPLTVVLIGQLQELPVAVGGGGHGQVGQGLAGGCGQDRGGVVCLWVSTPMTTSTASASMAIALCSLPGG
jgi:hypothetical protein